MEVWADKEYHCLAAGAIDGFNRRGSHSLATWRGRSPANSGRLASYWATSKVLIWSLTGPGGTHINNLSELCACDFCRSCTCASCVRATILPFMYVCVLCACDYFAVHVRVRLVCVRLFCRSCTCASCVHATILPFMYVCVLCACDYFAVHVRVRLVCVRLFCRSCTCASCVRAIMLPLM